MNLVSKLPYSSSFANSKWGWNVCMVKVVRGAASFALGQFAEHLQPEINEYYERVLPCIFTILSDPVPEVQVDRFCFYFSVQSPSCCWRFSTHHNCNGQKGVAKGFHWLGSIMKKFNEFFCRKRLSIHLQHFVRTWKRKFCHIWHLWWTNCWKLCKAIGETFKRLAW